jgi:hypothetical protein
MAKSFDRPPRRTSYPTQPGGIYSAGSKPGLPIPIEVATTGDLSRPEAERELSAIESDGRRLGERLLAFRERNGWRALGYASWKAFVAERLTQSLSTIDRQLQAARARRDLIPDNPDETGQDSAICGALDRKATPQPVKVKPASDREAIARSREQRQQARLSDPEARAVDEAIAQAIAQAQATCSRCNGSGLDPGPDA